MPSVFISYSWDTEEHKQWVRAFATRLREDGIETVLDQWDVVPGDRLPAFMEKAIRDSNFVLIICTPPYKEKSDRREGGAGYEGNIITGELVTTRNERKFVPVLRLGREADAIPTFLAGKYHIDLRGNPYNDAKYQELVATLLGTRAKAPPVSYAGARMARGAERNQSIEERVAEFTGISIPLSEPNDVEVVSVVRDTMHFEEVQLETHKVRKGYVQDEKEIVTFRGRKLYEGSDFRGPCEVYQKEDGELIFYYQSYDKMIYTKYDNLDQAARARKNGYPVHDRSAIIGAAAALGVALALEERQI